MNKLINKALTPCKLAFMTWRKLSTLIIEEDISSEEDSECIQNGFFRKASNILLLTLYPMLKIVLDKKMFKKTRVIRLRKTKLIKQIAIKVIKLKLNPTAISFIKRKKSSACPLSGSTPIRIDRKGNNKANENISKNEATIIIKKTKHIVRRSFLLRA